MQGQSNEVWAQEAVKWGADFMVNSVEEDQVLLHIGDIQADHSFLGRPEYYPESIDRNIVICQDGGCSHAHIYVMFFNLISPFGQLEMLVLTSTFLQEQVTGTCNLVPDCLQY